MPLVKAIVIYNVETLPEEFVSNSKIFLWERFLALETMQLKEVL